MTKEKAQTLWHKNLNLTRDIYGRENKVMAMQLTHADIEASKIKRLSSKDFPNGKVKI